MGNIFTTPEANQESTNSMDNNPSTKDIASSNLETQPNAPKTQTQTQGKKSKASKRLPSSKDKKSQKLSSLMKSKGTESSYLTSKEVKEQLKKVQSKTIRKRNSKPSARKSISKRTRK